VTGKPVTSTFHDISDDIPKAAGNQRAGICRRLLDQLRETGRSGALIARYHVRMDTLA